LIVIEEILHALNETFVLKGCGTAQILTNMKHNTLNTQLTFSVETGVGFLCMHGGKYAQMA